MEPPILCMNIVFFTVVLQCAAQLLFADLVVVLDMAVTISVVVFFDIYSDVTWADT